MVKKGKKGKYSDAPKSAKALRKLERENSKKSENGANKENASSNAEAIANAKIGRPVPEMYPNVVATFGTNADKVHENARSIQVDNLTVSYHGVELVHETSLKLSYGQRYGMLGLNGTGKTTVLRAIASRMVPIPKNIDCYTVEKGMDKTDKTALQAVLEVGDEIKELEAEAEMLSAKLGDESLDEDEQTAISDRVSEIYERLDEMDAETAEMRAGSILSGLGFTKEMQAKATKDFSGGWRMRISLARALFLQPTFLILDEPTNHLDMEAVVWFENYLKNFDKILLLTSHSQDFLNNVCTNIILLRNKKLEYYGGNYDTYIRTRKEMETQQMKRYDWEQEQIKSMKEYIARFGHGSAKLARQAQSKEKTLEKMIQAGLTEKVKSDVVVSFVFHNVGKLPPPVLALQEMSFAYPGCQNLYEHVDFGLDLDSRVALVGPNGAGKTTMLNLFSGELQPTGGMIRRHHHLKMSKFAQHFVEEIPLDRSPLEYMCSEFPKDLEGKEMTPEKMRSVIGRFGITGKVQTMNIGQMSDGQVSRLAFARIYMQRPHMILLDEPTNHLDMESIDSLAEAINNFDGGMVLVSHDMRLIEQVAKEIWICDKGTITRFPGSILDFKARIEKDLAKQEKLKGDGSKKN
uniref:ABC transporter domain-containing protein n=1 Tax=Aplanochytrium stocchinoi TaxID=215587 RepID=A0A7S3LP86_9STRA|mmetsp:Transcript_1332/g.2042  ORF Transcript_1332/g.2042 Transcript_1332/m.2042 type:complete len:634 (-) Transcript_1332:212-2113(-)|eukprot:CAMPEP_0204827224 /NCGR_PEP_ID=MMETSP1346-20131115/4747_1 /ASSEMBLY_ACC=CAM_ASM_000771 /TAXON_ID=215587 /ORGANISM="Aplanochytrium stocchinoi, Strain GSBS06" /LENGTH=633 /DNA_ID=CAMNT_0051955573 /DNA_START=93 /DNA_END=1994 /DNA_ORIENTATION=-